MLPCKVFHAPSSILVLLQQSVSLSKVSFKNRIQNQGPVKCSTALQEYPT
jgi:hypothetical protein